MTASTWIGRGSTARGVRIFYKWLSAKLTNFAIPLTEKPPASAHFSSTNILLLHNVKPLISLHDEVQFLFKTRVGHGLLFYTGDGLDYLALLLRDGKLILSVNLGGGPLETRLHPDHLNVDDGQWHSVRVSRRVQEVS